MSSIIKFEEGYRSVPYWCSEGFVTIGYGTKICNKKHAPLSQFNFTINKTIAEEWLNMYLSPIKIFLDDKFVIDTINKPRQLVLESMCYQLGINGFNGFVNMIKAIDAGDWEAAAKEALNSKWAKEDTPIRAKRHAEVLRTGTLDIYKRLINKGLPRGSYSRGT